ncbi:translocation/assembly module TamB domain-containing protein [Kordiimonas aquimaris]|uniref:translocation/assembly module TamB domain-containing protein n=1 Tax=Kordiimonas aquimaris TaxID=707591 RepID=UPI0021D0F2FE|nr:translocation/assembly module TamB domain-containing protein [Kordiimonas aquimaris]
MKYGRILAILVSIVIFGLISGLLYLDTGAGKRNLVSLVNSYSVNEDSGVTLGAIEGSLYSGFNISSISLYDEKGVWLDIENAEVEWSFYALLTKHINISDMAVQKAHLKRFPTTQATTTKRTPTSFTLPVLPVDVSIDRFNVSRIETNTSILGKQAVFQSKGALHYSKEYDTVKLKAELVSDGKYQDQITVDIAIDKPANTLFLDMTMEGPKGGVFGPIIGISPEYDVVANLDGEGALDSWKGVLLARVDTTEIANATLETAGPTLTLRANLNGGNFIPDTGAALFGRTATLAIDVKPAEKAEERYVSVALQAETITLDVTGYVAPDNITKTRSLGYSLKIIDAEPFNRFLKPVHIRPFTLQGKLERVNENVSLSGDFATLSFSYEEGQLNADLGGEFLADFTHGAIDLDTKGIISNISGDNLSWDQDVVAGGLDWSVGATIDSQDFGVAIHQLSLTNALIDFSSKGEVAGELYPLQASLDVSLKDISTVLPMATGRVRMLAEFQKDSQNSLLEVVASADADELTFEDPSLNAFIGAKPTANLKTQLKNDGSVSLSSLSVKGSSLLLQATADISSDQEIQSSAFELDLIELEKINELDGMSLAGGVNIAGNLSGPVKSPTVKVETELSELTLQAIRLQNLKLQLEASNILATPDGTVTIRSDTSAGELIATAVMTSDARNRFIIPKLDVLLGHYSVTGKLEKPIGQPFIGAINVVTSNQVASSKLPFGHVTSDITLANINEKQQVEVSAALKDFVVPLKVSDFASVESGIVSAKLLLDDTLSSIEGNILLTDVFHPDIQIDHAAIALNGTKDAINYTTQIQKTKLNAYDITLFGDISLKPDDKRVSLSLDGTLGDTVVRTSQPILSRFSADALEIEPFSITLGNGEILGDITLSSEQAHLQVKAKNADLGSFYTMFPSLPVLGVLDGSVALTTEQGRSEGVIDLTLSEVQASGGAVALDENLLIALDGKLSDGITTIDGKIILADTLRSSFSAAIPLRMKVNSLEYVLPQDEAINGEINWQGNIGAIWPMFEMINHDLDGVITAKLNLSGTLGSPDIDGDVNLNGGSYDNTQTGFVAENIQLGATIADRRLTIDQLTATDGGAGQIEASGSVLILENFLLDADASLSLKEVNLVRQPEIAIKASSTLNYVKQGADTSLMGDVVVESANIGSVLQSQPSIVELDVREINGQTGESDIVNNDYPRAFPPTQLDINFTVPNRLFIRSYGLDSEWSSQLKISGSSEEPIVKGTANLLQGTFDFSGKRFSLTKGDLLFQGDDVDDPVLNISAEHQLPNLTAILSIQGRASEPTLEISSVPSFPQDEILSRVFFGTSVAALSPIEGVQLASTIHSFTNGGGQGVLGNVRRTLGVDRLSINQSAGRDYGTTITGGKYLTDNIYVEVTSAPATQETATAVEVGLTKNLSLITRRTLDHDSNLAIRWSWNY